MINPYESPEEPSEPATPAAPERPTLPGLGIVAGIFAGVFLWQFAVERVLPLEGAALSFTQGVFLAVCILAASIIDGYVRPNAWSWRSRLKSTVSFAATIIVIWTCGTLAHETWGLKGYAAVWLIVLALWPISKLLKR